MKDLIRRILRPTGLLPYYHRLMQGMLCAWHIGTGPLNRFWRYTRSRRRFIQSGARTRGKKTISLLCPTRGRPKGAERLARSIQRSAAFPGRVEVLFYVDSDDEEREAYRALHESAKTRFKNLKGCVVVIGEPMSVSKSWNIIAERSTGDVLIMANDDQVYVDYGWDTRLDHEAEKYPDDVYCMWFNDGCSTGDICTFPIISRTWYKAVGYYAPGIFEFIHNDTWIWDIAVRVGRTHYIPDVLTEHLHFRFHKSFMDKTYRRCYQTDTEGIDLDAKKIFREGARDRESAAERLRAVIGAQLTGEGKQ